MTWWGCVGGTGKSAWGIELSKAVLEQEAPDLLKDGFVEAGILTNLPYANNRSSPEPEVHARPVGWTPDRTRRNVRVDKSTLGHCSAAETCALSSGECLLRW